MTELDERNRTHALVRIAAAFESIARDLRCVRNVATNIAQEGAKGPAHDADTKMAKAILEAINSSPK